MTAGETKSVTNWLSNCKPPHIPSKNAEKIGRRVSHSNRTEHESAALFPRAREANLRACLARIASNEVIPTLREHAGELITIVVNRKVAGCLYAGPRGRAPGLEKFRPALIRVRDLIAEAIGKTHPATG